MLFSDMFVMQAPSELLRETEGARCNCVSTGNQFVDHCVPRIPARNRVAYGAVFGYPSFEDDGIGLIGISVSIDSPGSRRPDRDDLVGHEQPQPQTRVFP